jgi:carboxymethylenebutenolidase
MITTAEGITPTGEIRIAVVRDIALPLPDGSTIPAALALPDALAGSSPSQPADKRARPAVVVIHEVLGLTDDMRRIAARFADAGYPTVAPDFFAGLGPKPICIARFARAIGQVGASRPYRQLAGVEAWLAGRPEVNGGPIGVAGFCMGGGFALLHAVGAEIAVVAPFYAAVPRDGASLDGICPVVASYGGRDGIFAEAAPRLDAALEGLGVDHDVKVYPEAGHAFMSRHGGLIARIERRLPTRNAYDPEAAEDAWRRTLAFFGRHLGTAADA